VDEAPVFDSPELVLRPSKRKQITALFGCLAFVGVGVWEVSSRDAGAFGWLCTLFFGLGAAVFTVQIMPGASYLRVRDDGFMYCSLFRKSPVIPWRDVSIFRVASVPPSGIRLVVFDWHTASHPAVRRVNQHLTGATDGLPDSYGLSPQELADLLNTCRSRATVSR
jgi:hypothetical protein